MQDTPPPGRSSTEQDLARLLKRMLHGVSTGEPGVAIEPPGAVDHPCAAMGLPPFGLFLSELTIVIGGLTSQQTTASVLILVALLASFCGILQQLSRILPGARRPGDPAREARQMDGVPAMALLLAGLCLFSVWLPAPLLELLHAATTIIGGKP